MTLLIVCYENCIIWFSLGSVQFMLSMKYLCSMYFHCNITAHCIDSCECAMKSITSIMKYPWFLCSLYAMKLLMIMQFVQAIDQWVWIGSHCVHGNVNYNVRKLMHDYWYKYNACTQYSCYSTKTIDTYILACIQS